MPIINTQTDTGNNVNYTFTASSISLYTTASAIVMSDYNIAISVGTYSAARVHNDGRIVGYYGIATNGSSTTIFNSSSGVISGYLAAIAVNSNAGYSLIDNAGSIVSANNGIQILGGSASVNNSGSITGYIGLSVSGSSAYVNNSGIIVGQIYALYFENTAANAVVNNSGLISSGTSGVQLGANATLHNSGSIVGAITLGTGTNLIDGIGGTITGRIIGAAGKDTMDLSHMIVSGTISGGLGDDKITGTAHNDLIYGDNVTGDTTGGIDTLAGGFGDDTIYGGYGADTLTGNQGDDVLFGNEDNDWVHGGQGNDLLYGGQGDDIMNGGLGNDALAGGIGNDLFRYDIGFGLDAIADFGAVAGNNDVLSFGLGTFNSYAEVSAHMVQAGANVVITLDAADAITLANVTLAQLTADHFYFG